MAAYKQRHGGFLLRDIDPGRRAGGLLEREAAQNFLAILEIVLARLECDRAAPALENTWTRRC
jgi:hypothetical protein